VEPTQPRFAKYLICPPAQQVNGSEQQGDAQRHERPGLDEARIARVDPVETRQAHGQRLQLGS
jgi:hypothetical protein